MYPHFDKQKRHIFQTQKSLYLEGCLMLRQENLGVKTLQLVENLVSLNGVVVPETGALSRRNELVAIKLAMFKNK